jgi:hypothetical protein
MRERKQRRLGVSPLSLSRFRKLNFSLKIDDMRTCALKWPVAGERNRHRERARLKGTKHNVDYSLLLVRQQMMTMDR